MFQTIILPHFKKQLKNYLKKYPNLKDGVIFALEQFNKTSWPCLGHGVYKIRVRTKDIPKEKNKSFRVVALLIEVEHFLIPITIYFKGDQEDITKKEINNHLEIIINELETENNVQSG